ncbi:MAG: hypothetical protein COU98_00445, partial [Candidatus Staskawiczbacteria bacterium CG10_big_fil_rev_8_21_14_0_10_38_10]
WATALAEKFRFSAKASFFELKYDGINFTEDSPLFFLFCFFIYWEVRSPFIIFVRQAQGIEI